jgi:dUTP pyrophosphatase
MSPDFYESGHTMKVKAKILYLENYDRAWGPMAYAHDTDTGFDARACVEADVVLAPGERAAIPLGFKLGPASGYGFQIRGRSGNAKKLGLGMANGVGTIDNGYRGEVHALVINFSDTSVKIERGMKIAQVVVEPVVQFEFEEIASEDEFEASSRGEGGFGSTGTR